MYTTDPALHKVASGYANTCHVVHSTGKVLINPLHTNDEYINFVIALYLAYIVAFMRDKKWRGQGWVMLNSEALLMDSLRFAPIIVSLKIH